MWIPMHGFLGESQHRPHSIEHLPCSSRQIGDYASRILKRVKAALKGAKPADLPIRLPTSFERTLNLLTAKTLGIDMPPPALTGTHEVAG
jgi:putative ABC transport system substrate-binding protein